jgi:hypothetical protein
MAAASFASTTAWRRAHERALAIAAKIISEIRPIAGTPGESYPRDVRKIDVGEFRTSSSEPTRSVGAPQSIFTNPDTPCTDSVSAASSAS